MKFLESFKRELKQFSEERIISIIVKVIEAILLVAILAIIAHAIIEFIATLHKGYESMIISLVEDAFLLIIVLEIFQSIVDFGKGKGRSVVYIMDASISFLLREIIIEVFEGNPGYLILLTYAGIILTIAVGRFLITKGKE